MTCKKAALAALFALFFHAIPLRAAAPAPVCPAELRATLEKFPRPQWPSLPEDLDVEEGFSRMAVATAAYGKVLESYRDPAWWDGAVPNLQACLRRNPDPKSEENLTPPLQIEGDSRLRLVIVQGPYAGMYYQYYPLLLLRGPERNFVLPLDRRATRCEAPGTVWLEVSKGHQGKVAVGANTCGLNPDCDFETFRVEDGKLVAENLSVDAGSASSRFTIPAWLKPYEIGCPSLIRGSQWAKSVKYFEPNNQCSGQKNCPEYIRGELKLKPAPAGGGG